MLNRLPAKQDVIPVYALIASIVFGWSTVVFLWKIPSWSLFLDLNEILTILAYMFAVNLLESLGFLSILLFLSFVLPARVLKDKFAVRGGLIGLSVLGSLAVYMNRYIEAGRGVAKLLPIWMIATLGIAIVLCVISSRFPLFSSVILLLADRLIVFLYILVPLASISLMLVILRGIF